MDRMLRVLDTVMLLPRKVTFSNALSLRNGGVDMRAIALGSLLAIVSVAGLQGQAEKPQKPVKQSPIFVESIPPPDTLTEMVAQSDAVVIVRATGRTRPKPREHEGSTLETIHSFDVLEVIKYNLVASLVAGEVLDLDMRGGMREYESYIRSEFVTDWDPILPNQRYLIFLRRQSNDFVDRLIARWGAAGIIDITGTSAKSLDKTFTRYNKRAVAQLLDDVRAVAKGANRP